MRSHRPRNTLQEPTPVFRPTPKLHLSGLSETESDDSDDLDIYEIPESVQDLSGDDAVSEDNAVHDNDEDDIEAEQRPRPGTDSETDGADAGSDDENDSIEDDLSIVYPAGRTPTAQPPDPSEPQRHCWPIKRINKKKTLNSGLTKWNVKWQDTVVPGSAISKDVDGNLRVLLHGIFWYRLRKHTYAPSDPATNEPRCKIHWKGSWVYSWQLTWSDLPSVKEYMQSHEDETEISILQPRFWQEDQDLAPHITAPVSDFGASTPFEPKSSYLYPEKDADYTFSFLQYCVSVAQELKPDIIRLLSLIPRQPLIFSDTYADSGKGFKVDRPSNFRALLYQIFGRAQEKECGRCESGKRVFNKCVTEDSEAAGACGTCSHASKATKCEYHHNHRQRERPKWFLEADAPRVISDDKDTALSSSPEAAGIDSPRSSHQSARVSTPASSPPSEPEIDTSWRTVSRIQSPEQTRPDAAQFVLPDLQPVPSVEKAPTEDLYSATPQPRPRPQIRQQHLPRSVVPLENSGGNTQREALPFRADQASLGYFAQSITMQSQTVPSRSCSENKRRRIETDSSPKREFPGRHVKCPGGVKACVDTDIGYPRQFGDTDAVHNYERFGRNEAELWQVAYILSCCPCKIIDQYETWWLKSLQARFDKGMQPYDGKEAYLAFRYHAELTARIAASIVRCRLVRAPSMAKQLSWKTRKHCLQHCRQYPGGLFGKLPATATHL